jgi:hypothetical protein
MDISEAILIDTIPELTEQRTPYGRPVEETKEYFWNAETFLIPVV